MTAVVTWIFLERTVQTPSFLIRLTDSFQRRLMQDHTGVAFVELFEQAQLEDHLLSVKLLETMNDPAAMVAVTEAIEAAAQLSMAAFIAANAGDDRLQWHDAERLRSEARPVFERPDGLIWLVGQFYLDQVWSNTVEQWLLDSQDSKRPAGRVPLRVTPDVFRHEARAFLTEDRQRLDQRRPRGSVVTFNAPGRFAVPVFRCEEVESLRTTLAQVLGESFPQKSPTRRPGLQRQRGMGLQRRR